MKHIPLKRLINADEIRNLLYTNAESGFLHTTYQEESQRFYYLMAGDERAIEDSVRLMTPDLQGNLSDDPVRNIRYLFIINTGLATRYMIEAGIPQETVYAISDLYIRKADHASSVTEIMDLNREVWTVFVETVRNFKKETTYSKPVVFCLNYIDSHFTEKITLEILAQKTDLNPCYLSSLFKKETGKSIGNHLMDIRIKTAMALLSQTEYSYAQIAYSLAFCSQSHFTKTFRSHTGYTPKEYRTNFHNSTLLSLE